jgi:hypothetical protein
MLYRTLLQSILGDTDIRECRVFDDIISKYGKKRLVEGIEQVCLNRTGVEVLLEHADKLASSKGGISVNRKWAICSIKGAVEAHFRKLEQKHQDLAPPACPEPDKVFLSQPASYHNNQSFPHRHR